MCGCWDPDSNKSTDQKKQKQNRTFFEASWKIQIQPNS